MGVEKDTQTLFPVPQFIRRQRLKESGSQFELAAKHSRRSLLRRLLDRDQPNNRLFSARDHDFFAALSLFDETRQIRFRPVDSGNDHSLANIALANRTAAQAARPVLH